MDRPGHLDSTGGREVVFCHVCAHEWYHDESGLMCPRCASEATEIVTPENDPRFPDPPQAPSAMDHFGQLYPWDNRHQVPDSDSESEVDNVHRRVIRGPGNSFVFTQTITNGPGRRSDRPQAQRDGASPEDAVMQNFQNMLGGILGQQFRGGPAGRSGPEQLFRPNMIGGMGGQGAPVVIGGRYTYGNDRVLRPRDPDRPQPGPPPPADLTAILNNLFGAMGPTPAEAHNNRAAGGGHLPPGLPGLLASLLNPANAVHGDGVYSQEAFDRIISQMMEQHPSSNAPGPAPADAIASLPKKSLDHQMLGPEGKGECSVCMDDVFIGGEVVVLPCSHWFHESCAGMWLGEHNTCPICRKSIGQDPPSSEPQASSTASRGAGGRRRGSATTAQEHLADLARLRAMREQSGGIMSSERERTARDREARLDYIRNNSRLDRTDEDVVLTSPPTRRNQSDSNIITSSGFQPHEGGNMPGAYPNRSLTRQDSLTAENLERIDRLDRHSRRNSRSSATGNGNGGGGIGGWWNRIRPGRHD